MESHRIEYKSILTDDIEREVVGFLNANGGELIVGADKDGKIVGLENADYVSLALADRLKNNIAPATLGLFEIVFKREGNKDYLHVTVASGYEKPYHLKKFGMTPKGCFIRVGSQTSPMTQDMIDSLYARRVSTISKALPSRQNLTFTQLKLLYESKGFNVEGEYFLRNLDFYTEDGKFNYLAYLMSDENATMMRVVRYAGKDKVIIRSKTELGGCCLLKSAFNILEALNLYNETAVEITYPKRIETRLVHERALREAVLNAIIHNDYINGTEPVVEFYDDRVEVVSSGGLPYGLSKEEFFAGKSLPRNRELVRIFSDMELAEKLGSGMQRILGAYSQDVFEITNNFITVKFMYDKKALDHLTQNGVVNEGVNEGVKMSEIDIAVLNAIKNNPYVVTKDLAKNVGKSVATIERSLQKLKNHNYISRVGSAKKGHWKAHSL